MLHYPSSSASASVSPIHSSLFLTARSSPSTPTSASSPSLFSRPDWKLAFPSRESLSSPNGSPPRALSFSTPFSLATPSRPWLYLIFFVLLCVSIFVFEYVVQDREHHRQETMKLEQLGSLLKVKEHELKAYSQAWQASRNLSSHRLLQIEELNRQMMERDHALNLYRELTTQLQAKEAATEAEQAQNLQQAQRRAQMILNQTSSLILSSKSQAVAKVETVTRVNENGDIMPLLGNYSMAPPEADSSRLVDADGAEWVMSKSADSSVRAVDARLIIDLGCVIVSSAIGGSVASFLRQPVLLGYLLAGSVIGPGAFRLIAQFIQIESIAELGTTFLLFALGLEFSIGKLRKVGKVAVGAGSLALFACTALTAIVSYFALELPVSEGVFCGTVLAMSSTTVVMKAMMERENELNSVIGNTMIGLLLVQDAFLSVILSVLALVNVKSEDLLSAIFVHAFKFVLLGLIVFTASYLWPLVLRMLNASKSHDLFLLGLVALCVLLTVAAQRLIGSAEVGAFLSGLLISSSPNADAALVKRSLTLFEPVRDLFGATFFCSIGMLIQPQALLHQWLHLLVLVLVTIVGKTIVIALSLLPFRLHPINAIYVALCLSQIGEFGFVLASQGLRAGLINRDVYLLLLGSTALSIFSTPGLISLAFLIRDQFLPLSLQKWNSNRDSHDREQERARIDSKLGVYGTVGTSLHSDAEGTIGNENHVADDKRTRKLRLSDGNSVLTHAHSSMHQSDDGINVSEGEDDFHEAKPFVRKNAGHTPMLRSHLSTSSLGSNSRLSPGVNVTRSESSPGSLTAQAPDSSSTVMPQPSSSTNSSTTKEHVSWRERRRQRQIAAQRRLAEENAAAVVAGSAHDVAVRSASSDDLDLEDPSSHHNGD